MAVRMTSGKRSARARQPMRFYRLWAGAGWEQRRGPRALRASTEK